MTSPGDLGDTIARVRQRADLRALVERAGVRLARAGQEYKGCCPFHSEKTPSFTLFKGDAGGWRYKCFGCSRSGDAIQFVMEAESLDFPAAVLALARDSGADMPETPQQKARREARAAQRAADAAQQAARKTRQKDSLVMALWRAGAAAENSIVAAYLRGARRLPESLEIPPTIRFISRESVIAAQRAAHWKQTDQHGAMVAAIQDAGGGVAGVHLTFLLPDGSGRPAVPVQKRMLGRVGGGAVRFGPAAARIWTGEGIETSLSVLAALAAAPPGGEWSVWAALSLGNIAGGGLGRGAVRGRGDPRRGQKGHKYLPSEIPDMQAPGLILPDRCHEITICGDGDGKDPPSAAALLRRAARRWEDEGRLVRIAQPAAGLDFNDLM